MTSTNPRPLLASLDGEITDKASLIARIRTRSRNIAMGSAAAAAALALAGCGGDITEGKIVERKVEPENSYVIMLPIKTGDICTSSKVGNSTIRTCTPIYTYFPYTHYDDQDWVLKLEDCSQDKCRYGKVYVSEAVYLAAKLGDHYVKGELDATSDDVSKRRATKQEQDKAREQSQTING